MEALEPFLQAVHLALKHPQDRQRAEALLQRWATAWQGPTRRLSGTASNHGAYLHFDQRLGTVWTQVFTFHAAPKQGLVMRGPDPDRVRKAHKHRANKLDRHPLDALFDAWSAHGEARPANNAVEFSLQETPDETWEACLREALAHVKG
ncbi:MAG: hypothetical protein LWX11_04120 [Firmicutes bacterium]|nr:hypothetical protein [Bacillota bacterium]